MKPESYYTGRDEGDIAYIQVRPSQGRRIVSHREPWGLSDQDQETGELVGLEVWDASRALAPELLAALPRVEGRGESIGRDQLVHRA
jgi:uncharacterized protein YuzE